MSFMPYISHSSLLVTSIGGITFGITLLLLPWKSMSSSDSSQKPLITKHFKLASVENNCTIINHLNNVPKIINLKKEDYISVSCTDKTFNPFPYNWKGLFPKSIFKSWESLDVDQKIDVRIEDKEENFLKIIVSSSKFSIPKLSAEWTYFRDEYSDWVAINFSQRNFTENIYLLLREDEEDLKVIAPKSNFEIINSKYF